MSDSSGKDVATMPGRYHLQGLDHLVLNGGGQTMSTGADLTFVSEADGKAGYSLRFESRTRRDHRINTKAYFDTKKSGRIADLGAASPITGP